MILWGGVLWHHPYIYGEAVIYVVSLKDAKQYLRVDYNDDDKLIESILELNEKNAFCMVSDYTFVSAAEDINRGTLQHLAVNTEQFERVEKLEVAKC